MNELPIANLHSRRACPILYNRIQDISCPILGPLSRLFFFFFFPSHVLSSPFLFSLPPSRNTDPGSHSRLFFPPPHYGSCLVFLSREDFSSFFPRRLASNRAYPRWALSAVIRWPFFIFCYNVEALVLWATGERLTNHLPKLILTALYNPLPPSNGGMFRSRPDIRVDVSSTRGSKLWAPRESDLSGS